jgi:hypothetical protein
MNKLTDFNSAYKDDPGFEEDVRLITDFLRSINPPLTPCIRDQYCRTPTVGEGWELAANPPQSDGFVEFCFWKQMNLVVVRGLYDSNDQSWYWFCNAGRTFNRLSADSAVLAWRNCSHMDLHSNQRLHS